MIIQEFKKMFSIRKLLLFAGFAILFYLMFLKPFVKLQPGSYHEELGIARSIITEFGPEISKEEAPLLKEKKPVYEKGKLDEYIAGDEDFASHGIHSFEELMESIGSVRLSLEEENRLWFKLYDAATDQEVSEEMSRLMIRGLWDFYIKSYENEAAGNGTSLYENLDAARLERVAARNRKEVYSVLPSAVANMNFEVLRCWPVFMMLSVIFWVMPYMVSENRSRMTTLQYSSGKGRRYYGCKLAAVLLSCLILLAAETAAYCLIARINCVFDFWNGSMSSFSSSFICWFPMTLGEYSMAVLGLTIAISLGMALVTFVITGYLNNYINAIAWQLPLAVASCLFGGLGLYRFGEITSSPVLMPLLAALMLAAGIAAAAIQAFLEKKKDLAYS